MRTVIFSSVLFSMLLVPAVSPALAFETGLEQTAQTAGLDQTGVDDPTVVIGRIIGAVLGFVGLLFFGIVLYAGILWMTASGNEDRVKKAKGYLTNATIGLIIVTAAYAITTLVVDTITGAEVEQGEPPVPEE